MAGNSIRISTDQVNQIAANIERMNGELEETLQDSKAAIDGLKNIWQGEAAEETVASYDAFAAKYFENYKEIIQQYVTFLRSNVETGYVETENANVNLAEAFK